jgi:peptidoglycan lytic transglycosylase G
MSFRALAVIAFIVLGAAAGLLAWRILTPTDALRTGPLVVEIVPHEGVMGIAERLRVANVIPDRWSFVLLTLARGSVRRLKAGEYEVAQGARPWDVLRQLESGRVRQHTILQAEGATVLELAKALENERLATAEDVSRAAADPALVKSLGLDSPSLEGYLFPDTYQFVRGMTSAEMLTRMVQRMKAKLTPEIRERALRRNLSLHALLTLASIVEREAVAADEQRLIAAVFWNRLKLDMPLQADPTVQYAVRKERGTLTRADLQFDSPYNTYRYAGLPPGPIGSPGLGAIEAVLDPAPVNYLYFVAESESRHHFSTTMAEHNTAVARYRSGRSR